MFHDDYTIHRPADFDYNAAIAEMEEKVSRKKKASAQLAHFQVEIARLKPLEEQRRAELNTENADVVRLQRISPAMLLYTLMGKKADMLAKEEAEAWAAAARYETVKAELAYAESRVGELTAELRRLGNCERYLDELLEEKRQRILAEDDEFAEQAAGIEREIKAIDREIKALDRTIDKGARVRGIARSVCDQLQKAYDLGCYTSRDVSVRHMKHEYIENAQAMIATLQQYVQDFTAELEDAVLDEGDIPSSVGIGEGFYTLEFFFGNVFTDFAVLHCIENAQGKMDTFLGRIEPILERLMELRHAKEAERTAVEGKLKNLIQRS